MTRRCFFVAVIATLGMPVGSAAQQRGLSLFAHAVMNADRKPALSVSIQLPYPKLVFLKRDDVFEARYRVTIRVLEKDSGKLSNSIVLNDRVEAPSYRSTRSRKNSVSIERRFALEPGDYIVRCQVQIRDTHLRFVQETEVMVPDFLETGIGLSLPRPHLAAIDTSRSAAALRSFGTGSPVDPKEKKSTTFTEFDKQPAFTFDVYVEGGGPDTTHCDLVFEVIDSKKRQYLYGKERVKLLGKEDQFVVSFAADEWDTGRYVLHIKAFQGNPPRATETRLPFVLAFSSRLLTRYFDKTMTILGYVATPEELAPLRSVADSTRVEEWAKFWGARDPDPETERNEALDEHLERVRFVDVNFSQAQPGWQGDRGKVYIRHGPPDNIEVRRDPNFQGEYLVWHYFKQDLTFVFYDRFGLGEYRLGDSSAF